MVKIFEIYIHQLARRTVDVLDLVRPDSEYDDVMPNLVGVVLDTPPVAVRDQRHLTP